MFFGGDPGQMSGFSAGQSASISLSGMDIGRPWKVPTRLMGQYLSQDGMVCSLFQRVQSPPDSAPRFPYD